EAWEGPAWVRPAENGAELVLVRTLTPYRPRWWLHGLLLAATLFTTHMAGALLAGVDPFLTRFVQIGGVWIPYPTTVDWPLLARGAPFALPFVGILLAHEMGHYLTARRHGVAATPPFFIPFPAYWSVVGSLGAFIRIRGPMVRRSVLLDVGAAGPLASFLLSLPVALVGLSLSQPVSGVADLSTPYVISFTGEAIWIGNGAAFHALASFVLPGLVGVRPILLHPVAFAGWLGLFVTALNLLPLGQLDGGHILYALRPAIQARAGRLFLLALLPLGLLWWGWWPWAVIAFLINRGRVRHPAVLQGDVPLDRRRAAVAVACIIVFFLTFAPVPLRLSL
ncbi:MAG TPA: site-2 protease family protein, partial [Longimicrobiales bacterium]|nr:site-2 protease family protein [Longimicrobiales bacterium]